MKMVLRKLLLRVFDEVHGQDMIGDAKIFSELFGEIAKVPGPRGRWPPTGTEAPISFRLRTNAKASAKGP